MYQSIGFGDFCDAFERMGRAKDFSYAAKRALFDWIEEYESGAGEETELDVIALCCDWSEHASSVEALRDLGATAELGAILNENGDDIDEAEPYALKYLEERSTVVAFDGGILVSGF